MKKLFVFLSIFLLSLSMFGQSSEITFTSYTEDFKSLNLSLDKAHKTTGIGVSMFIGGLTTATMGVIFINASETGDDMVWKIGNGLVIGGGIVTLTSIPIMVIGNKKATEVLFQMIKYDKQYQFNTSNLSLGIGVRKRF